MNLYVDEDLTPTLVGLCHSRGYEATCVRDRGLLGARDAEHFRLCQTEDRVFITNNTVDFTGQCETAGLHPGLITMPNHLTALEQQQLLHRALDEIASWAAATAESPADFMVNKHVVARDDGTVEVSELP